MRPAFIHEKGSSILLVLLFEFKNSAKLFLGALKYLLR